MSSMKLFVGNLPYDSTERELTDLFSQHGTVVEAKIIADRETGRSRGFGFVTMSDETEGRQAIDELNEASFGSRRITVNPATSKGTGGGGGSRGHGDRAGGGGFGGGRGGYGSGSGGRRGYDR